MFVPSEKGTTIRVPSTANLMVDSADRPNPDTTRANDFQISRNQSILNGYFTRIGTTEVVLEYNTPNFSVGAANNTLTIDVSGSTSGVFNQTYTVVGFYTAEQLIKWMVAALDAACSTVTPAATWGAAATVGIEGQGSGAILTPNALVYVSFSGPVAERLGIDGTGLIEYGPAPTDLQLFITNQNVDLRPFRYLDFISAQLTYNQDLKDSSTAVRTRDVLCRWYMAYDDQPALDGFGFPILMGYTPFKLRRIFSPPKQIRWDNIQPLGNIAFQVYTDQDALAPFTFNTNWLMTLQVSEV